MTLRFDNQIRKEGFKYLAGFDEVGRGALAGPVVAACVILPAGARFKDINDSKKLSRQKRKELDILIRQKALAFGIGQASEYEIERFNIIRATFRAMKRALDQMSLKPDFFLIDGRDLPDLFYKKEMSTLKGQAVVKGDGKSVSIAAASIIAKVYRDKLMANLALEYSDYGFENHKGYATTEHIQALESFGASPIHRRTFIHKILNYSDGQISFL